MTLPNQTIDRGGTISVPYAGRIVAAGKSKEEVERNVEDKLASRAIEPQVVISTVSSVSSQVAVLGDVNSPKKIEVSPAGDRILDALSEAGGLATPGMETNITLQRRGKTATVAYETLLKNPIENIYIAPGDTIFADRHRRTFVAFGAAGNNGRFDFDDTDLSLNEGIGKAGGFPIRRPTQDRFCYIAWWIRRSWRICTSIQARSAMRLFRWCSGEPAGSGWPVRGAEICNAGQGCPVHFQCGFDRTAEVPEYCKLDHINSIRNDIRRRYNARCDPHTQLTHRRTAGHSLKTHILGSSRTA